MLNIWENSNDAAGMKKSTPVIHAYYLIESPVNAIKKESRYARMIETKLSGIICRQYYNLHGKRLKEPMYGLLKKIAS